MNTHLNRLTAFVFTWLIVLRILLTAAVAQQASPYTTTHYTDENGLPQNSVNAIARGPNGFLWLATESGLVRFDGRSFFTFDKTALQTPDNRVKYLLPRTGRERSADPAFYTCDGRGGYAGVNRNARATGVERYPLLTVKHALGRIYGVNANYIVSLPNAFGPFDVDTLKSMDLGILPVGQDRYFLRRNGTIECYQGGNKVFSVYFPRNKTLFYCENQLFAPQTDGSLYRIDKDGGHAVTLTGDIIANRRFGDRNSRPTYFWNNISQQLFVHLNGHLYQLKPGGNEAKTSLLNVGMDLDRHGVIAIYMDNFRNIFLGCRTEGLYMLTRKQFNVLTAPEDSAGNVFYATAAAGNNAVLTRRGYLFDLAKGTPFPGQGKPELERYWHWAFFGKDKEGNLWVVESTSPVDRRLAKYSGDGKRLLAGWDVESAVESVYCDPFGLTWFHTTDQKLYYVSSADSGRSEPVLFANLPSAEIETFYRSGRSQLWYGNSRGLHMLNMQTRVQTTIKALSGRHVRSIFGSGDELWICTNGDGLYLYKDRKLTHFPLDRDKYMSSVHCIVPDSMGHFWITTNKGLFEVSRSDLLDYARGLTSSLFYRYFDRANGFNTNEFNGGCQPCGLALRSGNISFPTINGIVYFNPRKLAADFPDRGVWVEEVVVDGKPVSFGEKVIVKRDFEQIQIFLSTPYFGNKKNISFSYHISDHGNKRTWIPVNNEERIYLTGLYPGKHTLHIRKANGFGRNNFAYSTLEIIVPPYWFETEWFAVLALALSGILAYFFLGARSRYMQKQSYHENLLRNARLYGNIITSINHDIQTPMHYVIYAIEQINRHLASQQQPDPKFSRMGNEALASVRRISTLTNNLLQYLKVNIYQHDHTVETTWLHLSPLISEIVEMFSSKIVRDHIKIVNNVAPEVEFELNPQLFSVILHNLIDNAVKVSKNGTISFEIEEGSRGCRLVIADSGNGISRDIADWLMNDADTSRRAHTHKNDQQMSATGGLGLFIVKDLCQLLGIALAVESVENEGTRLYLTLRSAEMRIRKKTN